MFYAGYTSWGEIFQAMPTKQDLPYVRYIWLYPFTCKKLTLLCVVKMPNDNLLVYLSNILHTCGMEIVKSSHQQS